MRYLEAEKRKTKNVIYLSIIYINMVCACSPHKAVLSTPWHPAHPVPVLIHLREIQAVVTKLRQRYYQVPLDAVKGGDSAMPCHRTGYDRRNIHTHSSNSDTFKHLKNEILNKRKKEKHLSAVSSILNPSSTLEAWDHPSPTRACQAYY